MKVVRCIITVLLFMVVVFGMGLIGQAAAGGVYEMAIFEDPTTVNVWAALGPRRYGMERICRVPAELHRSIRKCSS